MIQWNVVATAHEKGFTKARRFLEGFGLVETTPYFNVLVIKVPDIKEFTDSFREEALSRPEILDHLISRIIPVTVAFLFQTPEEFDAKACEAVAPWIGRVANKRFHVRMHRRGFAGRLSSQTAEQALDEYLMHRLAQDGTAGQIAFDDVDVIIAVESVGQRAGLSLWERADLEAFPFAKLD